MWDCILSVLQNYQTIFAGCLALTGVIIALMGNSHIARRERRAKILHYKQSLKVTLLAELRKLQENVEYRFNDIGGTLAGIYVISADPLTSLFREQIDKLGLLPPAVLDKVLPAYLAAEHLPKNLRVFHQQETPADVSPHFVVISQERFEIARGLHRNLSQLAGEAMTALQNWTPTASD